MLSPIDDFYDSKEEPTKSCLLLLKEIILNYDGNITEEWKYQSPFFYYKNKMFCYLWIDKSTGFPYIGIVKGNQIDHPELISGDRKQIKIVLIDPDRDISIETIHAIFEAAVKLY